MTFNTARVGKKTKSKKLEKNTFGKLLAFRIDVEILDFPRSPIVAKAFSDSETLDGMSSTSWQ